MRSIQAPLSLIGIKSKMFVFSIDLNFMITFFPYIFECYDMGEFYILGDHCESLSLCLWVNRKSNLRFKSVKYSKFEA